MRRLAAAAGDLPRVRALVRAGVDVGAVDEVRVVVVRDEERHLASANNDSEPRCGR